MKYLVVIIGLLVSGCAPEKRPKQKSCVLLHTAKVCCDKVVTNRENNTIVRLDQCDDNIFETKTIYNPVNIFVELE